MAYSLTLLTPEQIPNWWFRILPLVEMWLKKTIGEFTKDSVSKRLLTNEWQAWVIMENMRIVGLCLTTITVFDSGLKVLQVPCISGSDCAKWLHFFSEIKSFAEENQCTMVTSCGRKGWSKVLSKYMFTDMYTVSGIKL